MPDIPPYPGAPRWVRFFISAILVVVLAIALLLHLRGGVHGPGRHAVAGHAKTR